MTVFSRDVQIIFVKVLLELMHKRKIRRLQASSFNFRLEIAIYSAVLPSALVSFFGNFVTPPSPHHHHRCHTIPPPPLLLKDDRFLPRCTDHLFISTARTDA